MGLGKTLLKVAIGVAVAKGVSALVRGTGGAQAGTATLAPGRGTRLDGGRGATQPGALDDLMGEVLGTRRGAGTPGNRTGEGNTDLLEQLTGKRRTAPPRRSAPQGGLEGALEQMTGARTARGVQSPGGGLGDLLGAVLGGTAARPGGLRNEDRQEISAALMLRAILQAVKCDGDLDDAEKRRLMEAMGDADEAEIRAVNAELQRPVDIDALVAMVPNGMEAQVYLASLTAIDLDQQAEARYLDALAAALELQPHEVDALHDRAGAPRINR